MIDGEELTSFVLEKNVTTLAVCVVDEQVEEDDGFEEEFVFRCEVEVVMVRIVIDELLERT